MTKYSQNYISTHDIDWFAKVTLPNGQIIPIHIASRGTELPDVVNNKEQNHRIQTKVAKKIELPLESKLYDDVVYVDYANHNEISNEDKIYLQTFGDMAHLGFYSFVINAFCTYFVESFNHDWMWVFVKCFLCIY